MLFSSLTFLFIYLPAVLLIYYIFPKKYRNALLFLVSLVFYAWGEPMYVLLMIFSTLTDYFHGFFIEKYRGGKGAKIALVSSIITNILILGVFKYSDFVLLNINNLFGLSIPLPHLKLPIGISFYTFQTMSYAIDLYRGNAKMQRNIITFGTYVTLFPQLVAGPIVRYSDVDHQLDHRKENINQFADGVQRFVIGMGKKVLFANNIGMVWSQFSAYGVEQMSVLGAWLGIIAYAFQIYFDFSGYSDMAIGLGKMLGFDFLENFNYPYISKSISEFWRRWHISLSTWFKEYVYIPLGGNRSGLSKQLRNILIVWLATGIWHGASWNFLFWGLYYAILLMAEKLFLLKWLKKAPAALCHIYTLLMVLISWVIFAFDDHTMIFKYLGWMFGADGIPLYNNTALFALGSNIIIIVILAFASTPFAANKAKQIFAAKNNMIVKSVIGNTALAAILLVCIAYLVDSTFNPFLYFRF